MLLIKTQVNLPTDRQADRQTDGQTDIIVLGNIFWWLKQAWEVEYVRTYYPSKFFSALRSYCSRLSVGMLSYDSRSTLIRLDHRKKIGRVPVSKYHVRPQQNFVARFGLSTFTVRFYMTNYSGYGQLGHH